MKQYVLGFMCLILVHSAFAHDVERIKSLRNEAAGEFLAESKVVAAKDALNIARAYQVTQFNPPQALMESTENLYVRVLKSILHRDFPITGDEGGYNFKVLENNVDSKEIKASLGNIVYENGDKDKLTELLLKNNKSGLMVLVGSGSGNNTVANIVAVVDPQSRQFVYLLNSNFGSDD